MKKFLCVLLSVCLLVGCLPLSAGAATLTGSQEELENFLNTFLSPYGGEYDASRAACHEDGDLLRILLTEASFGCYDNSLYPGEKWKSFPGPDPFGKWDYCLEYVKINSDRLDWIMKNIFNVSPTQINNMHSHLFDNEIVSQDIYYDGEYYYFPIYGMGGFPSYSIKNIVKKDNLYFVTSGSAPDSYEPGYQTFFSVLEPKVIDGNTYWTLYYNTEKTQNGIPIIPAWLGGKWPTSSSTSPTPTPTPGLPAEDNALMNKATEYGLLRYMESQVDLTANTTRVDMACLLAGLANADLSTVGDISDRFTDCGSLTSVQKAAVGWGFNNGILSGTSNNSFSPDNPLSRGMVSTMIWRMVGEPNYNGTPSFFTDVSLDDYYAISVAWGASVGILQEEIKGDTFKPEDVLIYRDALRWLVHTYEYEHNISFTPLPPPDGTTTNPTTELTAVEKKELEDFLNRLCWGLTSYDCNNIDTNPGGYEKNIYENMVTAPYYRFYDDSLYPGEKAQYMLEGLDRDPLGRFDMFGCISQSRVQWVLENIFNVSMADIDEMQRTVLNRNPNTLYLHKGYYYFMDGGVGGGQYIRNITAIPDGNLYRVTFETHPSYNTGEWSSNKAVVERKTIDGKAYWTLHSYGAEGTPKPTPNPGQPGTVTSTAEDGTVTTITTQADGTVSTKVVSPQKDVSLRVQNRAGQTLVNISIPHNAGKGKPFRDVPSSHWSKSSVDKATALNLFSGTSTDSFSPDDPMTRAMLVTVLHRLSGTVGYGMGTGNFGDVPQGIWYKNAVDWAYAVGMAHGTGTGFSPNGKITREDLVTMLYRYAQLIGMDTDGKESLLYFSDASQVALYAREAMSWAVTEGLVSGVGNNLLSPQGHASRAQVATILTRFAERLCGTALVVEPSENIPSKNGYYICPVCKFVNPVGTSCIACEYGYSHAKPEVYCPTCGGGYDVGGAVPWELCVYCNKYFVCTDGPYHSCLRCQKSGLTPYELDPESELCKDCYDLCYCQICHKHSYTVVEGVCENCSPHCKNCGVADQGRGQINGYCPDCYALLFS